eukprot:1141598-Pelagomonas_calceolata.AAC.7
MAGLHASDANQPACRVILPIDLLDFKPQHKVAMLRAFGTSMIAADNATAAELASNKEQKDRQKKIKDNRGQETTCFKERFPNKQSGMGLKPPQT